MRTITYTVGVDSISPSTVRFAGFAGEDCATTLKFTFNEFIRNEVFAKLSGKGIICLEVIDGSGEFGCYVLEEWATHSTESASFAIPKEITKLGGRVNMQLSIVELDDVTFEQKRKLFTYPIKLRFSPSTSGGVENAVEYERYHTDVLSAMVRAELAADKAEAELNKVDVIENIDAVKVIAEKARDNAQTALEKSEEADAKYEACVEATNDAKAIKAEIEAGGYIESLKEINNGSKFSVWIGKTKQYNTLIEQGLQRLNCLYIKTDEVTADRVIEQGVTEDGWTYRKWSSGEMECYANVSYNGGTPQNTNSGKYWSDSFISKSIPNGWFIGIPTVFVSPCFGRTHFNLLRSQWSSATAESTGEYVIETDGKYVHDEAIPGPDFIINFEVKGKWK